MYSMAGTACIRKIVVLVGLFLWFSPTSVFSADQHAEVTARLQKEKLAIQQEQLVLEALRQRKQDLAQQQEAIRLELEHLEKRQNSIGKETADLQGEQDVLQQTISDLKAENEYRINRYNNRLVAMYKLAHRAASLHYLVQAESASDLLRRVHDLRFMVRYDQDGLTRLKHVIARLNKSSEDIALLEQSKNALRGELKILEASLLSKKNHQEKIINEVTQHQKKQERVVEDLKRSATKLEQSLAKIMGSQDKVFNTDKNVESTGFASVKGKMPYPVKGNIIQGYGKQKHKEFSDVLLVKGVEFSVVSNSPIKAVFAGEVLFSDSLPGYGTVIILDHGQRYYTLYGKLQDVKVKVGDKVAAQTVIATSAPAPTEIGQGNFYFELRHKGVAVDPQPYFLSAASK